MFFLKLRFWLLAAMAVLVLAVGSARAGNLEDGLAAFHAKDYAKALQLLRPAAEKGDAKAQTALGVAYSFGLGVPEDSEAGVKWLRLAADQGDPSGQDWIGRNYLFGKGGLSRSAAEALKWFRLAAAQGNAAGQFHVGLMYQGGLGVRKDNDEALKWLRLAAAQGQATAIGLMYESGLGVNLDLDEAARWYLKAMKTSGPGGGVFAKQKLESGWAMKAAAERVSAADAMAIAQKANSGPAASSDREPSSSVPWVLPVKYDQPVIHISRSIGGELSTTFLVKPVTPVVSPRDGVLIYKGPLNTSESGLVLFHGEGLYSVISSPLAWAPHINAPRVGATVAKGGALASAHNNSFAQIPVLWRLFRGVDQKLDAVQDLNQFIDSPQAKELGIRTQAQALQLVLSGSEIDTKKLMNLGAVQFSFGTDVAAEDDFSVTLRGTALSKADLIFDAFLLEAGQHELEVSSGRIFKSKKKGTVFARAGGTSIQIVQRASNGDIDASASEFIPNTMDLGLQVASSGAPPSPSTGARDNATKAEVPVNLDASIREQERLAHEAQTKETERLAQVEAENENLRLAQEARVTEQERLAQETKARELDRLAEIARVKEQERLAQETKARESERLAQAARVKEQERLTQEAKAREIERLAEITRAKEQELRAQVAKAKEQERLAQLAIVKEQERLAQVARDKEKERLAQEERVRNEALLAARQREEELVKLRQQLAKLEDEKVSKDQKTVYAARRALVIGNDSYKQVTKLVNAREDARAIAESLQQVGYQVTLKLDLTEKDMKAALRTFKGQVEGGDEVLVFFAGHGVQLGAANYLLPVDIAGESEEQIRDESIQLQRVLDDMHEKKAKFTLAMIDACRDNPFKTVNRAIGGRGLAPTTAATGQMVIFSAGAGQQALDKLGPADKSRNGLFTRIFLKEMQKPGVSIDKVVRNVRNEVVGMARSVGHEQVPAIYDQVVGEFYFRR